MAAAARAVDTGAGATAGSPTRAAGGMAGIMLRMSNIVIAAAPIPMLAPANSSVRPCVPELADRALSSGGGGRERTSAVLRL